MKKLNKSKIIIFIISIIAVLILVFVLINILSGKGNKIKDSNKELETTTEDGDFINIKSTKKNPIEKDGIEATELKMQILGDQLEVKTTLKNNTKEDLNGYMIEIELLDENGEVVTIISDNSAEIIKAGKSLEISNYVMELENPKQIKGARIKELTKNNMKDNFENIFEEMIPDEMKKVENSENDETMENAETGGITEETTVDSTIVGPQQEDAEE